MEPIKSPWEAMFINIYFDGYKRSGKFESESEARAWMEDEVPNFVWDTNPPDPYIPEFYTGTGEDPEGDWDGYVISGIVSRRTNDDIAAKYITPRKRQRRNG